MQDITDEQIQPYKKSIQKYKDTYFSMFGKQPSEKLIESHCKLNNIPWPLPRVESKESKPIYQYIAVDFDGTLCEHRFPEIGEILEKHSAVHEYIKHHKTLGSKLILWTCREDIPEGNFLTQAVEWCRQQGIEFDYVNENPECAMGHPEKVRKIVADVYIDDKAYNPFTGGVA